MKKKDIGIGIIAGSVFVLFFFWGFFKNISLPLGHHDDIDYGYFLMDHNLTKMTSLDFSHFFDTRMFYPHTQTLAYGNSLLTQSILGLPVFWLTHDVVLTTNVVILLNFFLSFLAMYVLCLSLTKNTLASIVAGLIYTYNPFVMSHVPQTVENLTLQWLPLFFLCAERIVHTKTRKPGLILGLLFVVQVASSFYYAYIVVIVLPLYILLRAYSWQQLGSLVKRALPGLLLGAVLTALYLRPYIHVKNSYGVARSLNTASLLSARVTDFLFVNPQNVVYGGLVNNAFFRSLRDPFALVHYTERSFFPGIAGVVLIVAGVVIYGRLDREKKKLARAYWGILGVTVLLSFGPYLRIAGAKIPGLFLLLYHAVPLTDQMRNPSRFMAMAFLALAVLSGITVSFIRRRLGKAARPVGILLIVILCVEFFNIAPSPYVIPADIRDAYRWLTRQKDIEVIAELPTANGLIGYGNLERIPMEDTQYLLYALYHDKKIVNGYAAFVPPDTLLLGASLSVNFPTQTKLEQLRQMGVDAVVVHRDEFVTEREADVLVDGLGRLGLKELFHSGTIHVFSLL